MLGLGLGDDWVGEFSDYGDEPDPQARARLLDEGLEALTGYLGGGYRPAPRVPIWMAGRYPNKAPMRRAAKHDGFFVIGLDGPDDLEVVTGDLAGHEPKAGFEVVVDLQPGQDVAPWLDRGASWVLTRVGPYDLDLDEVRRIVAAGP